MLKIYRGYNRYLKILKLYGDMDLSLNLIGQLVVLEKL